jgi:hypothetical protein
MDYGDMNWGQMTRDKIQWQDCDNAAILLIAYFPCFEEIGGGL